MDIIFNVAKCIIIVVKPFFTQARHNLNSQIEIDWPDSLKHDELSPLSKIKLRQNL